MKNTYNVLAIDWGSKYLWLAYKNVSNNVIFPVGYLINDGSLFFNLWDIISRYDIKKIVLWYPKKQEDIKEKIDEFIKQLWYMVLDDIQIEKVNEDYSTVQAKAKTWNYEKDSSTDSLAAVQILENYWNK